MAEQKTRAIGTKHDGEFIFIGCTSYKEFCVFTKGCKNYRHYGWSSVPKNTAFYNLKNVDIIAH
jgi:hypothetical protein